MATKPMPSISSGVLKEKRATPELTSVPIMPSSRPRIVIRTALSTEPSASATAETRPSTISEKYSAASNLSARSASGGANAAITSVATLPAKNDPSAAMHSAAPARPCRAIWWPSRTVTTDDISPGRLTRIAVVEPPKEAP